MTALGLELPAWSILIVSLLFAILWVQVVILHYRGAFRRIWMWEPVFYFPIIVVLGIITLFVRGVLLEVYGVSLILALLMGLEGFFLHVQGVYRQVGGWNLDNVMVGPPLMFPVSISLISLIGIFAALLWR